MRECAEAILANGYSSFEILVMDQSSDGRTRDVFELLGDARLRYFRLDRPGKCLAMNTGIEHSHSEILCFTDDDCIVTPNWIENIVREFDADPQLNAIYGQTPPLFTTGSHIEFATFVAPLRRVYLGRRSPYGVGGGGGNMAYRRSALAKVGPFDTNLGPGARFQAVEDNEYFYRTFCHRIKAIYAPSVIAYHKQVWDRETWAKRHATYRFGDGAFIAKYLVAGDWHPLYYYLALEAGRLSNALSNWQLPYAKFVAKSIWLTTKGILSYTAWYRREGKREPI